MTLHRLRVIAPVLPLLLIAPTLGLAQAPPTRGEATAALNQPANPSAPHYTRQQIDQLVAPIALYPDQLLSQVLMAATYPQQIAEAAQWLQDPNNAALKGEALAGALEPLPWDPSVKSLVAFPQIITMLNEHIEWTQALGVAFAAQQAEVMARIQALRHLAMRSGKLKQMRHLTVRQEGSEIVVVSAEPDKIYVPVYNPRVVYGEWPDRDYLPVYVPPPQGFVAETIEPGLELSIGYGIVAPLWGWSHPDWRANRITVDRTEYSRITRNVQIGPDNTWRHSGPVQVVTGPRATAPTSASVPAGTVAPGAAAAVAASQRAGTRTTEPQATTAQPSATPPAPKTETATTPPTQPKPGQAATTPPGAQPPADHPSTMTAAKPPATAPQPPGSHAPEQATAKPPGAPQASGSHPPE